MGLPSLISTFITQEFLAWESKLHEEAAAAIDVRIRRLQLAKKGDWHSVGDGVYELRLLQTGPGWRVYFHETNLGALILLLLGGDKSSQSADIKKAKKILKDLKSRQATLKAQTRGNKRSPVGINETKQDKKR